MTITIQTEFISLWIITLALILFVIYAGHKIKQADPREKPKGVVTVALMYIEMMDKLTSENMGSKFVRAFGPYIGTVALYICTCNLIGLLGLPAPTSNLSVTLVLAFISWCIIQGVSIKENKLSGYIKGFFEPFFLFLPINIFGKLGPLVSMSLRLFGNILVGGVLMSLVYSATSLLCNLLLPMLPLNIIGPIIAPVLHAYFDVFAGVIQTYIFISLTTVLAGNEAVG